MKKFEYNGKMYSIPELAKLAGIKYECMYDRLVRLKWNPHRAVNTSPRQFNKAGRFIDDTSKTLEEIIQNGMNRPNPYI